MYMIRISIAETQDKKLLRAFRPMFIWMLACFILLVLMGRLPYYWITVPLFFITFPLCIPIFIITYKRTAPIRNMTYKKTTLTFDMIDGKVFMDGKEVWITMNTEAQFIISISDLEGYAIKKSDTQEFLEFLEMNAIPYERLAPEGSEEIRS